MDMKLISASNKPRSLFGLRANFLSVRVQSSNTTHRSYRSLIEAWNPLGDCIGDNGEIDRVTSSIMCGNLTLSVDRPRRTSSAAAVHCDGRLLIAKIASTSVEFFERMSPFKSIQISNAVNFSWRFSTLNRLNNAICEKFNTKTAGLSKCMYLMKYVTHTDAAYNAEKELRQTVQLTMTDCEQLPVKLPLRPVQSNDLATIAGWGYLKQNETSTSSVLRVARMRMHSVQTLRMALYAANRQPREKFKNAYIVKNKPCGRKRQVSANPRNYGNSCFSRTIAKILENYPRLSPWTRFCPDNKEKKSYKLFIEDENGVSSCSSSLCAAYTTSRAERLMRRTAQDKSRCLYIICVADKGGMQRQAGFHGACTRELEDTKLRRSGRSHPTSDDRLRCDILST
ncbi:unnamed protein product [Trichogramma brassicae]|uniref:Peptidase S1 domain-containing protein n=1 Tax=Trichogramma brassicae TaxID=86971 RepID=A0A6H5IQ25_9HYME|nr:unnamed protein product [Trichogramma brassicae]